MVNQIYLLDECTLTQEELSKKISKSRSSITNHIRLLKLPADIQAGVRDNLISMGHARALVSAGDEALQLAIFNKILFNVREIIDENNFTFSIIQTLATFVTRLNAFLYKRLKYLDWRKENVVSSIKNQLKCGL